MTNVRLPGALILLFWSALSYAEFPFCPSPGFPANTPVPCAATDFPATTTGGSYNLTYGLKGCTKTYNGSDQIMVIASYQYPASSVTNAKIPILGTMRSTALWVCPSLATTWKLGQRTDSEIYRESPAWDPTSLTWKWKAGKYLYFMDQYLLNVTYHTLAQHHYENVTNTQTSRPGQAEWTDDEQKYDEAYQPGTTGEMTVTQEVVFEKAVTAGENTAVRTRDVEFLFKINGTTIDAQGQTVPTLTTYSAADVNFSAATGGALRYAYSVDGLIKNIEYCSLGNPNSFFSIMDQILRNYGIAQNGDWYRYRTAFSKGLAPGLDPQRYYTVFPQPQQQESQE